MAFQKFGLSGYNQASRWQEMFQIQRLPLFIQEFQHIESQNSNVLRIADYGCSEGKNSVKFFKSAISEFRNSSQKMISLTHTDLPDNNWSEFQKVINGQDSYLTLPQVYSSAIGRSFYNQLFPENSIHLGYSAFAFHYLSQKPIRKPGEVGLMHSGFIEQGLTDMENILRLRSKELVPGGILFAFVGSRTEEPNIKMGSLYMGPLNHLIKERLVSEEEVQQMEMNTYAMTKQEWQTLMKKFEGTLQLKYFKAEKSVNPFYLQYLQDNDLEKYKTEMSSFVLQVFQVQVRTYFKRSEEEYQKILETCKEHLKAAVQSNPIDYHLDFATVIIEKLRY